MATLIEDLSLITWNSGEYIPSISATREALREAGIDAKYAEDHPISTAFRRACDTLRKKGTLVTVFEVKRVLHVQIDRQETDDEHKMLERTKLGVFSLDDGVIEAVGWDYDTDMRYALREAFGEARRMYEWGDIGVMVQKIIEAEAYGVYSPRAKGGIYFCPISRQNPDLLDKLERFGTLLPFEFLRFAVPDSSNQRKAISNAISNGIGQEVQEHEDAIAKYTSDCMAKTFTDRRTAMNHTIVLMTRLAHLLGDAFDTLSARIDVCDQRITELIRESELAERPAGERKLRLASA